MRNEDGMSATGGERDPFDIALNSGAYALNALTDEEKHEFEAHMAGSQTTRDEVTEMAETAALLGLSVTPVEPSPDLKRNLMAMLASTPQLPREDTAPAPVAADEELPTAQGDVDAVEPPAALSARSEAKTQARWFRRPALAITAVAAALALIVGGSTVVNLVNDATYQQQQADQLAQITTAEDMQQSVAAASTGGTATLMWSAELAKSVVVAEGLPELADNETYELWYISADGVPTAAGMFTMSDADSDTGSVWRVLEGEMRAGDTVGVTVEPRGGSEQPTTDPIVAISSAA